MNFFKKKNDIDQKEILEDIPTRISETNIGVIYGNTPMYIPPDVIITASFGNDDETLMTVTGRVDDIRMMPFTQVNGEYLQIRLDTSEKCSGSYMYIRIFENCATYLLGKDYLRNSSMARPPRKEHRKRCTNICINTVRINFNNDNRVSLKVIKAYNIKGEYSIIQGSKIRVWYEHQYRQEGKVISINIPNYLYLDISERYFYKTKDIDIKNITGIDYLDDDNSEPKAVVIHDDDYIITNPFIELYELLK